MRYAFDEFELDSNKFELRKNGALVPLEPQVFSLLELLVKHRDEVVSKDEIIENIWRGRAVSDASIASRIRLARKALGDDGSAQRSIRTIYGRGFRFVADVTERFEELAVHVQEPGAGRAADRSDDSPAEQQKPSIVILPFQKFGPNHAVSVIADAIPHDLIQALSRLRWLFVIARGSAFRFRAAEPDVRHIGKTLGVRYCLVGSIEITKAKILVSIELSDTHDGGVVWAETFASTIGDVHVVRTDIVARVVTSLETHIPLHEAHIARLGVSENLDAWSNYHLALQHMYRFTQQDNAIATVLLERAVSQDPGFARAYAGLSFTHFQDAFVNYNDAPDKAMLNTRRFAERSLELDPLDPFANFTMGRYFLLEGAVDSSADWLDRALMLNPNYAQCIYSQGFAEVLSGQSDSAHKHVNEAFQLSPLDPLLYGMLGVRALSFLSDGDFASAAQWAEKAARSPGAHYLIAMIAVVAHSLNLDNKQATYWADAARQRKSDASQVQFFESFPFADPRTRKLISRALTPFGL